MIRNNFFNQRQNKYHVSNKERRTRDGIVFASKAEMARYDELKMLEKAGKISNLELQPKFLLIPKIKKGERATYYIADFAYLKDGKHIIEDVKGFKTAVYKLKIKLLLWKYPEIIFLETKA